MRLLGSTDSILPYALEYSTWILISAPAMASSCVMNNILRYEGKAFFAMLGLASGGILNIFGDMFHGKNSGGFGKRGFGGREFSGRGSDVEADVAVSFDEAVFGGDKVIHLRGQDGNVQSLQVHIPAGIETGKTIRLRGKGNPGINGGGSGDLLLRVTVGEKPGYERKGRDIYTTVQIPYTTAVFGGEARVKTIHGEVICKIREGTQSGSKIRLRGKGVVSMKNPSQYGDQYVTVQIQVPKNLSAEAKQKLKEFEKLASQSSNGHAA